MIWHIEFSCSQACLQATEPRDIKQSVTDAVANVLCATTC